MAKSRRITVRVPEETYQALTARKLDLGSGLSHVLRDVLNGSLKPETVPNAPQKPILRPAEIDPLVDHYRMVVDEDPRKIRNCLFGQLLAVSYVCKERYPRTPGIIDGYQDLLRMQKQFGYGDDV